jgi:hypothetical protein
VAVPNFSLAVNVTFLCFVAFLKALSLRINGESVASRGSGWEVVKWRRFRNWE